MRSDPAEGSEIALLRRGVDKLPAMLAYWDSEQRCVFANRAYQRWFGVSPEILLGTHIRELLALESFSGLIRPSYEISRPYIEAALRGEAREFEREVADPLGGPSRHSLVNYMPDVVDGVVRGFFVQITDISQVKHTVLALEQSEAKFSGIIAIAADAIISVDEARRITIFNKGAERIFGYARAEVLGRELGLLLPALQRGYCQRVQQLPIMGVRKSGEQFPAEVTISELTIGGSTLLTLALRDVTERTRIDLEQRLLAEAGAVLASSLDYKRTLETISELVVRHVAEMCIIDMLADDGTVRRLTVAHADPSKAAACETLAKIAVDPKHLISGSTLATRQPQRFDYISADFMRAKARNEEHLRVLRELDPQSAIVVPLIAADELLGALVLLSSRPHGFGERDISLATDLARRAALAIQNANLYAAEQRATRMRDEVLGVVAHDVRSPLHSIRLAAQMITRKLATSSDSANAQDYVARIMRSADRADRLIQDLLDVSRMEAGALTLTRDVVSALPVVTDAVASLRLLASAAALELQLEIDEQLPAISADRDRLLQVLENLIGNAIKFTPKGGRITVAAALEHEALQFSVADTGLGIPEHDLPRVFDRFWQAERGSRHGAGLGLPICKGIVEAHGGRIWAASTVGRGTTFFFTIPTVA